MLRFLTGLLLKVLCDDANRLVNSSRTQGFEIIISVVKMSWPEETFLTRLHKTKINSEGERHTGCSTNRFLILTYSPRNVIYKPKMSLES